MRSRASLPLGLLLTLLAGSMTACVGLPDDGPVVEARASGSGTRADAMAINPLGPQPDQSPSEVVKGFLDAMQATPIRDDVARQFLTERSTDAVEARRDDRLRRHLPAPPQSRGPATWSTSP